MFTNACFTASRKYLASPLTKPELLEQNILLHCLPFLFGIILSFQSDVAQSILGAVVLQI